MADQDELESAERSILSNAPLAQTASLPVQNAIREPAILRGYAGVDLRESCYAGVDLRESCYTGGVIACPPRAVGMTVICLIPGFLYTLYVL